MTKPLRTLAWRNMLVAGINAALDRGLIGLDPDDNRWEGGSDPVHPTEAVSRIPFDLAGEEAFIALRSIGHGELAVRVCIRPKQWLGGSFDAGYRADAHAYGWLERKEGKHLQAAGDAPSGTFFGCRRSLLHRLAEAHVEPKGYADHGPIRL